MKIPKNIYFLGIGGIGMSALARYFCNQQYAVRGYDRTPSMLTQNLEAEGVDVAFVDDVSALPSSIKNGATDTLVVYTPAIPVTNQLLLYFKKNGFTLKKRAEVLGMVTAQTVNLSIAGTHGKTTTSSIVATILQYSHLQFSAFLGGISTNLGSNYFYQKGTTKEHYSVVEADEFDRSFMYLQPTYAVLTSTDADHLDIYGKKSEIEKSYTAFSELIANPQNRFYAKGKAKGVEGVSYSVSDQSADYYVDIQESTPHTFRFIIKNNLGKEPITDLLFTIPGEHNLENAVGATLMALKAGVSIDAIKKGLANFKGIKRRFEYVVENDKMVYIDDYAHHPSELRAIISSVKNLYPNKKITAVFQPHLYSRTQDFLDDFAHELSAVDQLLLLPIYPARELPIAGVTSQAILQKVKGVNAQCVNAEQVVAQLEISPVEVLLTLGAGDIDRLVPLLENVYG